MKEYVAFLLFIAVIMAIFLCFITFRKKGISQKCTTVKVSKTFASTFHSQSKDV